MSTVPKRGSGFSNQTVLILLGVAAFLLVGCIGSFLVWAILNVSGGDGSAGGPAPRKSSRPPAKVEASQLSPEQVLKVFLDEIKQNQLEDAYQRTSENFQGRMSQGKFEEYIHQNLKGLFGHTTRRLTSTGQSSEMRKYEGHAGGGPHPGCSFFVEITHEPEGWRINQFYAKK